MSELRRSDESVLVVDDDPSVRKALARLFRSVGLAVETFASAEEFLARAWPTTPCCLVLDMRMPQTSGLQLQEHLCRAGHDPTIVFLSGHADVPGSVRAMRTGAVDFLVKPFAQQELLAAVRRALDRDRRARAERAQRESVEASVRALTRRERQVLALVVAGLPNKLIADRLAIVEKTVKVHRGRVMSKMRAGSLAELVRMTTKLDFRPGVT